MLGISIEETNAGIGILASIISVWYRTKKNAGLPRLGPVPDKSRHRYFFHFGTGLIGCRTVQHSGIYTRTQTHTYDEQDRTWTGTGTCSKDMKHAHGHGDGEVQWMPECRLRA